jgi:hypothetical protein
VSRALNVSLPEADVISACEKAGVSISAIEPLPQGGTHLVCTISAGSDEMRRKLKSHLIDSPVKRFPFFTASVSR